MTLPSSRRASAACAPSAAKLLASSILAAAIASEPAAATPPSVRPFDRDAVRALVDATGGRVTLHPATGTVRFLVGDPTTGTLGPAAKGASPEAIALDFLTRHGKAFGLADPTRELVLVERQVDALGQLHLAYEQRLGEAVVFGAVLRVHFDGDRALRAVNGTVVPRLTRQPELRARPRLSAEQATEHARQVLAGELEAPRLRHVTITTRRLVVFREGLVQGLAGGRDRLAWEVEARGRRGDLRQWLYLDARNGKPIDRISGVHETRTRKVYNAGSAESQLVWQEGQAVPYSGGPAASDNDGINEIIEFSADAYELYERLSAGTYLSWDGSSAPLRAVWRAPGLECPNANWNGSTTNYCQGVTTDDVVVHEWTHAYTERTHGLIYQWQPGALNEAYSDLFGETADQLNGAGADSPAQPRTPTTCTSRGGGGNDPSVRWLIGERDSGGVIRDMWNPNCIGDPGKVSDTRYFCQQSDDGGVHSNSGVVNHAYALLVDGGSYNGRTIAALGLTRAAAIYWRAMEIYQIPTSDFGDHADALEASCDDLAAAGTNLPSLTSLGPSGESISPAHCAAVAAVIDAVELRRPPSCSFRPLLDQSPPPLCESGNVRPVLSNDFENGFGSWTLRNQGVTQGDYTPRDFELDSSLPKGRAGTAAFAISSLTLGDCAEDDESGTMQLDSPRFTLPAEGDTFLAFDHYVATENEYDGGNLKLSRNGGAFALIPGAAFRYNDYSEALDSSNNTNPLAGQPGWSGSDDGTVEGTWGQSQVDLRAVAQPGDELVLRFDFGVDGCNGLDGWYVDDVKVYQCGQGGTGPCVADADTLCLLGGRFRLEVAWQNQFNGASGRGIVVPNSDLTGFFAFDDPANIELIVKLLDFGSQVKVFYGQLTDLLFTITITDTETGAVRTYRNSDGNCGAVDDGGFAKAAVLARGPAVGAAACTAGGDVLCLLGNRFEVEVDWRNQFDGSAGNGVAHSLSDLTGLFTFTDPANVELLTKVLDFGDRILFIYGTLSNLEYTIRVTDTTDGTANTYVNPPGRFCGAIDHDAF